MYVCVLTCVVCEYVNMNTSLVHMLQPDFKPLTGL